MIEDLDEFISPENRRLLEKIERDMGAQKRTAMATRLPPLPAGLPSARGELSTRAILRQNPAAVFGRDDKAFCDVAFARALQQSIDRVLPHRLIDLHRYTIIGEMRA